MPDPGEPRAAVRVGVVVVVLAALGGGCGGGSTGCRLGIVAAAVTPRRNA